MDGNLICDKEAKSIWHKKKNSIFNQRCWLNCRWAWKECKFTYSPRLVQCSIPSWWRTSIQNQLRWIYHGEETQTHWHRGNFLIRMPMAYVLKTPFDKWDLIKLKSICTAKVLIIRRKWQSRDWEKISTDPTFDRELI